jgi:MFS family permease
MTARPFQSLRIISPTIGLYFVSTAVIGFAIDGGVYAVLLNLFLVRLGYGPELIGLVNSVGTLAFALACIPAGMLGGRLGTRRLMLFGLVFMLIGCLFLPLADTLPTTWQLPWLLVFILLIYLGLALYFVNTAPFVMDIVTAAQRNQIFSMQTALLSLASFVGSLLGGFLPPLIGSMLGMSLDASAPFRYALMVAGLAMIPAMLALRAARPASIRHEETPVQVDSALPTVVASIGGLMVIMALIRTLQVAGIGTVNTFFNVYLDSELHLPTAQIGAIIAAARLLGVPAALATSALTARFGNRAVVIGASLGTALSIVPIALVPNWGAAGLSFIGVVGLSWIRYASSLVYFMELVPPRRRATVSGIMEMAAGVCFTVIAFGGGYIIALFGYRQLFLLGAALTALSALLFWLSFRNRPSAQAAA